MWSLSEWRRQRILAQHPVAEDVWHDVRQHLSILDGLDDAQDKWLRESSVLFLKQKHLTPMPGVELTEEGELLLAAQAQLHVGLGGGEVFLGTHVLPALLHVQRVWHDLVGRRPGNRSEERRVGKECRSRWSPYH